MVNHYASEKKKKIQKEDEKNQTKRKYEPNPNITTIIDLDNYKIQINGVEKKYSEITIEDQKIGRAS